MQRSGVLGLGLSPPASQDGHRTPTEDALFKQGLGCLASLYSHKRAYTFRMTTFPKGYPGDYDLPHDLEMRAYSERGWCCTETCWAQLFKPFDMSLDVGLYSRSSKRWVDIVSCSPRHSPLTTDPLPPQPCKLEPCIVPPLSHQVIVIAALAK